LLTSASIGAGKEYANRCLLSTDQLLAEYNAQLCIHMQFAMGGTGKLGMPRGSVNNHRQPR
jgi:hypothetical protein